jgi:hypothetical protein
MQRGDYSACNGLIQDIRLWTVWVVLQTLLTARKSSTSKMDVNIDCSNAVLLDWYTIASYLQKQGLSYFDAKLLYAAHTKIPTRCLAFRHVEKRSEAIRKSESWCSFYIVEENIHKWRHPWTHKKSVRIDCESLWIGWIKIDLS